MSRAQLKDSQQELANFFAAVAPGYEWQTHLLTLASDRRWRRFTVAAMRLARHDRVLDLATGTGQLARGAAAHPCAPRVTAVDTNPTMLRLARQKSQALACGRNLEFALADARQLPFADNTFKAITMGFGLRILPERPLVLRECLRVLRPGGRVYFLETAPLKGWLRKGLQTLRPFLPPLLRLAGPQLLGYRHLLDSMLDFPSIGDLHRVFCAAGFAAPRSHLLFPPLAHLHVAEKPLLLNGLYAHG